MLWSDMSDPASFTESGGTITSRINKISSTAMTVVSSPGYLATGLNGLPTADFLPSYFLIGEAATAAVGVDTHAYSYFCVSALNIIDSNSATLFGFGNSGVVTNRTRRLGGSTSATGRMISTTINDAGTAVSVFGVTQTDTTPHIYTFITPGTTIESWIDNVEDIASTTQDPGTITVDQCAIGARPDSGPDFPIDGQSSEEWLFDWALDAAARTRVCNYLKAKWGTP